MMCIKGMGEERQKYFTEIRLCGGENALPVAYKTGRKISKRGPAELLQPAARSHCTLYQVEAIDLLFVYNSYDSSLNAATIGCMRGAKWNQNVSVSGTQNVVHQSAYILMLAGSVPDWVNVIR